MSLQHCNKWLHEELGTLLLNLFTDLRISASNVYFLVLILITPRSIISGVFYGTQLTNFTYSRHYSMIGEM